jgi:hypothetical protein
MSPVYTIILAVCVFLLGGLVSYYIFNRRTPTVPKQDNEALAQIKAVLLSLETSLSSVTSSTKQLRDGQLAIAERLTRLQDALDKLSPPKPAQRRRTGPPSPGGPE